METINNISTINEYNTLVNHETLHPHVSVIDFSQYKKRTKSIEQALTFGFYAVFLKEDNQHCEIKYGRNTYDYQQGTLVFVAPGQVVSIEEDGDDYQPDGFALLFHPDLLRGTALAHIENDYSFFSYAIHEALHLSAQEKQLITECFRKIDYELKRAIDKHSKKVIVSIIELFLNYCVRFYDRQFITRDYAHSHIAASFSKLLNAYFDSDKPQDECIPLVGFFASELNLSANYFGDLIKKETGKTALEHIQLKLIEIAKEKIFDRSKSISQIAYELGFKYPQHFTRFFKQQVGLAPNEYRLGRI